MILYPTLLRTPDLLPTVNPGIMATWPAANHLPLTPDAYEIVLTGRACTVREKASGEIVYRGAGPVELLECPVPF
jgi:hypothetical protein